MKLIFPLILLVSVLSKVSDSNEKPEALLPGMYSSFPKNLTIDETSDVNLNFDQMVLKKGYPLLKYQVVTEDNYILILHRISGHKGSSPVTEKDPNRRVVLFMHGFMASSDCWISNWEEKAMPFILANKGYDIWLGNNRGNKYSRQHVIFDPDKDKQFWDFSYHEMGTEDLPAILDCITRETGRDKIAYVGHSQGTTQLFAAMTLNEEYFTSKIECLIAFGPIISLQHNESKPIKWIIDSSFDEIFMKIGFFNEIFKSGSTLNAFQDFACKNIGHFCEGMIKLLTDSDATDDDMDRFLVFISNYPSGTSLKSLYHFFDGYRNNRFAQLDGTLYDLTKLKNVPIALYVGQHDMLSTVPDNLVLKEILTLNGSLYSYKEYPGGHLGFMVSKTNQHVYDAVKYLEGL